MLVYRLKNNQRFIDIQEKIWVSPSEISTYLIYKDEHLP